MSKRERDRERMRERERDRIWRVVRNIESSVIKRERERESERERLIRGDGIYYVVRVCLFQC